MIIKLYRQMTEIRIHAEKKCQKILRPVSDYSPTVQMWYDRLKEGKAKNVGNVIRFVVRTNIQTPDKLTTEELKDGLRYCQIQGSGRYTCKTVSLTHRPRSNMIM